MRAEPSKGFEKAARKLSSEILGSVCIAAQRVINAQGAEELTDCKKLVGYDCIYRLRTGSHRAFFSSHVQIMDGCAQFLYLVPRGQVHDKRMGKNLKRKDTLK